MTMLVCWYAHARGNGTQLPALSRRCDFHAMPTRLRCPMAILHGGVGVTRSVKIYIVDMWSDITDVSTIIDHTWPILDRYLTDT